jgi:hypothetical protein
MTGATGIRAAHTLLTPESYLGTARADRFVNGTLLSGVHDFGPLRRPGPDQLAYGGRWNLGPDDALAMGGDLAVNFRARKVYLVLSSPRNPRPVNLLLDGKPLSAKEAGEDVKGSRVMVSGERLYSLIDLPKPGRHVLTVSPAAGVRAFAFTFG